MISIPQKVINSAVGVKANVAQGMLGFAKNMVNKIPYWFRPWIWVNSISSYYHFVNYYF